MFTVISTRTTDNITEHVDLGSAEDVYVKAWDHPGVAVTHDDLHAYAVIDGVVYRGDLQAVAA